MSVQRQIIGQNNKKSQKLRKNNITLQNFINNYKTKHQK